MKIYFDVGTYNNKYENPLFYLVDEIKEVDIDTQLDFDFPKFLYKKHLNT